MYLKKEKNQISSFERDSFRKLKEQENKNRNILVSEDILYISDFTLEKFSNSGDSGDLYLATSKYSNSEKYILKHEYYDCACNEYMYSKIGNKMGVKVASVKLFILDNKQDKFKSDFVCGIKYLENCKHVNFNDIYKNKDNINNWEDYFRMFCLQCLFEESDGMEIVKYNNDIYRIDTTSSFTISNFDICSLAYDYKNNGINIREFANKNILKKASRNTDLRVNRWEYGMDYFVEKFGEKYLDYYLETFKLLEEVTEPYIENLINILTLLYPNIVGEYFKIYLSNLKLDVEKFFVKIKKRKFQ